MAAPPIANKAYRPLAVLAVIIVVVVATASSTYLLTKGGLEAGGEKAPSSFMLGAPIIDRGDPDGISWDATVAVVGYTHLRAMVHWEDVSVAVRAPSGLLLLPVTRPTRFGMANVNAGPAPVPQPWYIESSGGTGWLSVGDLIKVTGMPGGYEGAVLEVTVGDELIGYAPLPASFALSSETVMVFGAWTVDEVARGGHRFWDTTFHIDRVDPQGKRIPIREIELTLKATGGTHSRTVFDGAHPIVYDPTYFNDSAKVTPELWYVKGDALSDHVTGGDSIIFTGLPLSENYLLEVVWKGQSIGVAIADTGIDVL